MKQKNYKILVFSGQENILPILELLYSKKVLGGVAFSKGHLPSIQQIQQTLSPIGIPMLNYLPNHMEEVKTKIDELSCDIGLVFGFSFVLPKEILKLFSMGVYNIHPSLLPYYKGPQPLFWQIKNGEKKTAITLHKVTEKIDSGDIVKTIPININPLDTFGLLLGHVLEASLKLLDSFLEIVENSKDGTISSYPQKNVEENTYLPNPKIEDVQIDWENMTREDISTLVRAASPIFYGGHTKYKNYSISISQVSFCDQPTYNVPSGTILSVDELDGLMVATKNGALRIDIISVAEGLFTGGRFALVYMLEAGMKLG